MRRQIFILAVFWQALTAYAQYKPAEGAQLHYRIVGFSVPRGDDSRYEIEIARGHHLRLDSFGKNIITRATGDSSRIVAEVPSFGAEYTWRVILHDHGKTRPGFELHHFSTLSMRDADSTVQRLRIIQAASAWKDAYVFLDGNRALYDMKGNAVWLLPDKENFRNERMEVRDLKMTPQGTITFLLMDKAYEITYDGDIVWSTAGSGEVSGDSSEHFHHDFTRMPTGHYWTMGLENALWKYTYGKDTGWTFLPAGTVRQDSAWLYHKALVGTVIEYDENGRVVWNWKASRYLEHSDVVYHLNRGLPDPAVHENAFYFDGKQKVVYVAFRNISRILKISYPGGTVIADYGERYKKGAAESENPLFCRQHCCRRSSDGNLYLFNNNNCRPGSVPTLVMMAEPVNGKGALKKVWEYETTIEGVSERPQRQYQFPVGGSVFVLPDGTILACLGGTYSKVFIVDREKKELWSALPEKWSVSEKKWKNNYSYRASMIVGRDEMERLVWGKK